MSNLASTLWKTPICMLSVLLLAHCSPETSQEKRIPEARAVDSAGLHKDSVMAGSSKTEAPACDCNPARPDDPGSIAVSFSHWTYQQDRQKFDSLYRHYSKDSLRLHVKVMELNGYDTIPPAMAVFKNVEKIYLSGSFGLFGKPFTVKGLDQFPKLVSVNIDGSNIVIDGTDSWLKQLEVLFITKSKVKGLSSFKQTPRLKSLVIGHSGFEYFPKDVNSLSRLQEFNIEEYKFGKDQPHLGEIDLRNFVCLKTFRVWGGASGLPQGLDSLGKIELTLRSWAMSEEELKIYKAYKARIKNAG